MKYDNLPEYDKRALKYATELVSTKCEVYNSPSLYIIYLDDDLYNSIENKLSDIVKQSLYYYPKVQKNILYSPKKFKMSYEQKIDLDTSNDIDLFAINTNHTSFFKSYADFFNINKTDSKDFNSTARKDDCNQIITYERKLQDDQSAKSQSRAA